jgi:DNA helicase-2/ATP-dependent DNA helicase PcrA
VFGDYQSTEPSRFLDEIPDSLVDRIEPVAQPRWMNTGYELRNPYARRYGGGSRNRVKDGAEGGYSYETEDQSAVGSIRLGMRVRHRQFGVGTIVEVEDQGDDVKVTVRFASVGTKKLLVKFAGLEPA